MIGFQTQPLTAWPASGVARDATLLLDSYGQGSGESAGAGDRR
jgi:hypothetical protein